MHLKFCKKANSSSPKQRRGPKECWLVPAPESRSLWDWGYITKEILFSALGHQVRIYKVDILEFIFVFSGDW